MSWEVSNQCTVQSLYKFDSSSQDVSQLEYSLHVGHSAYSIETLACFENMYHWHEIERCVSCLHEEWVCLPLHHLVLPSLWGCRLACDTTSRCPRLAWAAIEENPTVAVLLQCRMRCSIAGCNNASGMINAECKQMKIMTSTRSYLRNEAFIRVKFRQGWRISPWT